MAKLVVETYINDVLDKEEKFSSLALYELQRPTSAADVPASEIPSDVFCIAVDTFSLINQTPEISVFVPMLRLVLSRIQDLLL